MMFIWEANPTIEDFQTVSWQTVISDSNEKTCSAYREHLREYLDKAEIDSKEQRVFALLTYVCAITMRLDSPDTPFTDIRNNNSDIQILSASQCEALLAILPNIQDVEIKARVADLLWTLKYGDFKIANIAVDAYLESANRLEDLNRWVNSEMRIRRALQISRRLGKSNQPFRKVINTIEEILNRFNGEDPLFFSARLMEQLIEGCA